MQSAVIDEVSAEQAEPAAALARIAACLEADEWLASLADRTDASADVYGTGTLVDAVIRPRSRERLARAVAAASAAGFAIVTRGGGMSYTGGYLASRERTLLVDMAAMNRILEIAPEDMYIRCEAGVTWEQIHEALKPLGLRLPFFGTFSGARATVGGGLSNGALFLGTARYGTAADCMLGMEVLLADGTLLRTGQRAFRNAGKPFYRTYGPDLSGLFVHDSGAFGIKVEATFRLIQAPAHNGYLSFVYEGLEAAGRGLSAVARTGAAEELYVFDPETTRKNLEGGDLARDVDVLRNVVKSEASLLKGLKEGMKMAAAGRSFLPPDACSLHMVCTGRTPEALEAELAACREAATSAGGREVPNSIPKATRASMFPPPDGVLGPHGDRWAALNAKVAHSDGERIIREARAALAPYADEMKQKGVWMSHLLIAVGQHAFSFEPVFHWHDEWLPIHRRMPSAAVLAKLIEPAPNPQARELVARLRATLVELFAALGAASNQIGKTYPYLRSLEPETARLVRDLKSVLDAGGTMNPGGLGL